MKAVLVAKAAPVSARRVYRQAQEEAPRCVAQTRARRRRQTSPKLLQRARQYEGRDEDADRQDSDALDEEAGRFETPPQCSTVYEVSPPMRRAAHSVQGRLAAGEAAHNVGLRKARSGERGTRRR